MKLLSDLPTDRAMKDMEKRKFTPAIAKVVEVMGLFKQDLVTAIRLLETQVRLVEAQERINHAKIEHIMKADKVILDWLAANPSYEVDLRAKE